MSGDGFAGRVCYVRCVGFVFEDDIGVAAEACRLVVLIVVGVLHFDCGAFKWTILAVRVVANDY